MPTYEYLCNTCGERFDYFQSISDDALQKKPNCEVQKCKITRIVSGGAGLIFKGSGFYLTDYKNTECNNQGCRCSCAGGAASTPACPPPTTTRSKSGLGQAAGGAGWGCRGRGTALSAAHHFTGFLPPRQRALRISTRLSTAWSAGADASGDVLLGVPQSSPAEVDLRAGSQRVDAAGGRRSPPRRIPGGPRTPGGGRGPAPSALRAPQADAPAHGVTRPLFQETGAA